MTHKVGDKVRIIAQESGHGFDIGEVVTIDLVNEYMNGTASYGSGDWLLMEYECEAIKEPLALTSKDAFRAIHEALNGAVDAALDNCDYERAIKYALWMEYVEDNHLNPPPATE
jgi:hypothetical protein